MLRSATPDKKKYINTVKCHLKVLTSENASFDGKELVPMGHPLECTIKYIHNRFERIPRGKRIRIAPLCHAEVDTESFLPLYNIYRKSVTLHQKRNVRDRPGFSSSSCSRFILESHMLHRKKS